MTHRYLDNHVDTSMGERVQINYGGVGTEADLTIFLDPDSVGYSNFASTSLDPMGLRALAAIALVTAREIEEGRPS